MEIKLYEGFKWINGYEGLYMINKEGVVYTCKRKYSKETMEKKPYLRKSSSKYRWKPSGYYVIVLSKDGKQKEKGLHRLLAETFIPNPYSKPEVNHIDGDSLNNSLDNLEWVTKSEQAKHAHRLGLNGLTENGRKIMAENGIKRRALTIKQAEQIRLLRQNGIAILDIADLYGVKKWTIQRICSGKTYA